MITTGNLQIDGVLAELLAQILLLSEQNAVKAGQLAELRAQLEALKKEPA